MNIISIVGFITSLFNIGGVVGDWLLEILYKMLLFFDGFAYTMLAYSFKLFQLMCTLNFNSLYDLVSPILTRIKALVMVFVVYKLGISLINFMLNPDEASKKGKEILVNIFVCAALLLSYNTIFGVFNELSMLIIGTPENYTMIYLGQIADLTDAKDTGLINRLVFGTEEEMPDVGQFIAFSVASTFITDSSDPQNTEPLRAEITDQNTKELNFYLLPNISAYIGKQFDYFPIVGFLAAGFMIFSFVKTTIQIGIRAFKLLILQVLAPIAIITIIGEGTKGKTFKNFLNKYIAVYIEAFIRMFSMLLICNFVVKFIRNIKDYFPAINTDEWYTVGLMIVLIIIAAFKFATDIPKFIDEILSTHLSTGKEKNFIGGLLGAGLGGIAGLIGGAAGGGLGGAIAGLGSGIVGGARAGAKGNDIAEFIKGQGQVGKNAKTSGQNIAARGGLGNVMLGGVQTAAGVGSAHDRRMAYLDRQSQALDALDAAEKYAVKDSKMGSGGDFDAQWEKDHGEFTAAYSSGYSDIKLGEDKDSYAAKMLDYDKSYQSAQAAYDRINSDSATVSSAQAEYEKARQAVATKATGENAKALQAAYRHLQEVKNERERSLNEAKTHVEEARAAAEKRAKDYYDARKGYEGDHSTDVLAKRSSYLKSGGKDVSGKGRTDEKRRIYNEKATITNSSSYQRTHGGNPKNK